MMQSAYRSVDRNPFGSFLRSMFTLIAFVAMMVPVLLHHGPQLRGQGVCTGRRSSGIVIMGFMTKHAVPWISYGWKHASLSARFGAWLRRRLPSWASRWGSRSTCRGPRWSWG